MKMYIDLFELKKQQGIKCNLRITKSHEEKGNTIVDEFEVMKKNKEEQNENR